LSEIRQRWRIVFGRDEEARYLSHLDAVRQWERALRRGGVPIATSEGFTARPRLILAAPLPLGMLAEHELADLFLDERLTARDLRQRLTTGGLPRGYRLVDLQDEWVGAPALATRLAAADYRLTVLGLDAATSDRACSQLLGRAELRRERRRVKEAATAYDLRPLILELRPVEADPTGVEDDSAGPPAGLWMRLRHSQDGGTGRPDEVVAAVAGSLSLDPSALEIIRAIRERLWLSNELVLQQPEREPRSRLDP